MIKRGVAYDDNLASSSGFWARVCTGFGILNSKANRYRLQKAYTVKRVCVATNI